MPLGSPQTNKYKIGTAEVRIGPLADANKLTQAHSVGLLDNVTVDVTQNSVDLLGGFPKFLADTAVISQEASLTATLREYSRRNMQVLLGEGVATAPTDVASLVVDSVADAATAVDVSVGDGTLFAAGDIVVIYQGGVPEGVSVVKVASVATDTLTLETDTPVLQAYDGTQDTIHIYLARQVAVGAITQTNYFACMVIESERATGRPIMWNFWKAAISSGLSAGSNADDFASTELSLKMLQPAATEYGAGADLEHLAGIIPAHPTGMYIGGGD
jgi:hypothetical protein